MTELSAKGMELLQEIVPHATRFGVFFSPTAPSHVPLLRATEAAGAKLRIGLHKVPVQSVEDFEAAFATMAQERLDGVLVHGSSLTGTHSMQLAELTLKYRLPTMFTVRDNVEAGGLMSYSPDLLDLTRRAATYIDKYCRARGPPICQSSRRTSSSSWSITKLPRRSG